MALSNFIPQGLGYSSLCLAPAAVKFHFQILHFRKLMYKAESWTKRKCGLYFPVRVLKLCHAQQARSKACFFTGGAASFLIEYVWLIRTYQSLSHMPTWNQLLFYIWEEESAEKSLQGGGGKSINLAREKKSLHRVNSIWYMPIIFIPEIYSATYYLCPNRGRVNLSQERGAPGEDRQLSLYLVRKGNRGDATSTFQPCWRLSFCKGVHSCGNEVSGETDILKQIQSLETQYVYLVE